MKLKLTITLFGALFFAAGARAQDAATKKAVQHLVNTVSRKGSIKLSSAQKKQMGDWLAVFGESVNNVRPWKTTGEGPTMTDSTLAYTANDIRYAESDKALYLFIMDVPTQDMRIPGLATSVDGKIIGSVKLMGSNEKMSWEMHERGLTLEKPKVLPKDGVTVFKITWQEYYKERPVDASVKILEN